MRLGFRPWGTLKKTKKLKEKKNYRKYTINWEKFQLIKNQRLLIQVSQSCIFFNYKKKKV